MRTLIAFLTIALGLGACVAQAPERRDNISLRHTIHDAVPAPWRDAASSTKEVSPLAVSPDLREFIHSTVRSKADDRGRILALTDAIVDPDGVGLVYDPDATHTASEAFRSGTANCLGFSNLLVASAREAGLNARFELVSHRVRWQKVGDLMVGTLHVRVVSLVNSNRMVFDFYPLPLESGYSTQPLSDDDAIAHHLNNLAARSMQDGDNASAFGLLSKALAYGPGIAFIWSNLGTLLSRQEMDSLAEAAFTEALSISPDELTAASNLQRLYLAQGRLAEAQKLRGQLRKHRERNPYYHASLAEQAYERGDFREAVDKYKEAVRLEKNVPEFYVGLSESYAKLGKSKAALRAKSRARTIGGPRAVPYSPQHASPEIGTRITRK